MNWKQIRHWSLMDIEYCPSLVPLRACNLLLGGTLRSFMLVAQWIYSNRRIALRIKSGGRCFYLPLIKTCCVSLSANVFIIA